MLVEFSVENYRSIAEKQTLSMVASSKEKLLGNTFSVSESNQLNLLKSAVIYGANASGKTNILRGLSVLKKLVLNSATRLQVNDKLEVEPFKLDQEWSQKPTRFEMIFIQEKVKYEYFLSLDQNRIYEESLLAYPNGRKQTWYSREYKQNTKDYLWNFGSSLKGAKERIKSFVRPNSLFLSHAVQNNNDQLTVVFNWFFKNLLIQSIENLSGTNFQKTANFFQTDKSLFEIIKKLISVADIDINDIHISQESILDNLHRSLDNIGIKNDQYLQLIEEEIKIPNHFKESLFYTVKMSHKINNSEDLVYFDLEDESHGTQRLFSLLGDILDAINQNKIVVIDELSSSLHPALSMLIAKTFNQTSNKQGTQLIFTTHDTTLLDKDIFRRDQIWFTEKNQNRATELYSLAEFEEIQNESLQKGYLQGRYGAIPFIGEFKF